eukprot:8047585-Prorocentrum_lima.AAC.1
MATRCGDTQSSGRSTTFFLPFAAARQGCLRICFVVLDQPHAYTLRCVASQQCTDRGNSGAWAMNMCP